jgi:hypothetical protein
MSKIIVKTQLPNPPPELWHCWGDPYQKFVVAGDGTVEGLTPDHPRYHVLKTQWKLVEEVVEEKPKKVKGVQDG